MRNWKTDPTVKKAYDDLYLPIDPNDQDSEIILSLIVKGVFVSEEERTQNNATWTQSILEIIFDSNYLSPKIESDSIDRWYEKLTLSNKVINSFYSLHYLFYY